MSCGLSEEASFSSLFPPPVKTRKQNLSTTQRRHQYVNKLFQVMLTNGGPGVNTELREYNWGTPLLQSTRDYAIKGSPRCLRTGDTQSEFPLFYCRKFQTFPYSTLQRAQSMKLPPPCFTEAIVLFCFCFPSNIPKSQTLNLGDFFF
ncbi:hypothetical protein AMECASPLE_034514 [Ameca splendens]|uniref:Uncharacterized protein n=1 Tax=Ameca splendens TaxID=208324 RepID=A0ABV1AEH5_9TELE